MYVYIIDLFYYFYFVCYFYFNSYLISHFYICSPFAQFSPKFFIIKFLSFSELYLSLFLILTTFWLSQFIATAREFKSVNLNYIVYFYLSTLIGTAFWGDYILFYTLLLSPSVLSFSSYPEQPLLQC